jgi:hypothetical protein
VLNRAASTSVLTVDISIDLFFYILVLILVNVLQGTNIRIVIRLHVITAHKLFYLI